MRQLTQSIQDDLTGYDYKLKETSYLGLRPGDLIQFTYNGGVRFGLVVKSKRTGTGVFLSSRYNKLLNVVQTGSLSEAMFSLMVNNLYKNRSACSYHSPNILSLFLGKQNFRTFNVSYVEDILSLEISK